MNRDSTHSRRDPVDPPLPVTELEGIPPDPNGNPKRYTVSSVAGSSLLVVGSGVVLGALLLPVTAPCAGARCSVRLERQERIAEIARILAEESADDAP